MGAVPAPAGGPLHQAGAMGNLRAAVQNLGCQAWAGGSRRRTESPHTAVRTRALMCTNLEPRDAGLGGKVHYLGDGCGKVRQGPAGVRPSRVALTRNSSSLWRNRAVSSPEGGRPQTMARFPRSCLTVRLVLWREAPHDAQQPARSVPHARGSRSLTADVMATDVVLGAALGRTRLARPRDACFSVSRQIRLSRQTQPWWSGPSPLALGGFVWVK